MRVDRPAQFVRIPRQTPVLEGTGAERGLRFDNGHYIVFAHELNGRGKPTGNMIRMASFASPDLAKQCRDHINAQNPDFQAQIETDSRQDSQEDPWERIAGRDWKGAVPIQDGPFYVSASYLDSLGRYAGGGAVSWFADEASATACANTLNAENPAHEAKVERDEEFTEAT